MEPALAQTAGRSRRVGALQGPSRIHTIEPLPDIRAYASTNGPYSHRSGRARQGYGTSCSKEGSLIQLPPVYMRRGARNSGAPPLDCPELEGPRLELQHQQYPRTIRTSGLRRGNGEAEASTGSRTLATGHWTIPRIQAGRVDQSQRGRSQ